MGSIGPDEFPYLPNDDRSVSLPLSPSAVPRRVLIVEDDSDGAESMAFLLGHHGHEVRVARTPDEAYREAERLRPEVVLLDIRLRAAETGYAVAQHLRRTLDRRPLFVVITGTEDLEERSRAEGIDHHFLKPVDFRRVLSVINSA
jgi:CheY-like chemotaxis protein